MNQAPEKPLVVLFDVDGTLVLTGGAGRRAMRRAFAEVHGCASFLEQMDLRGMTDQRILSAALVAAGERATAVAIARVIEVYLPLLEAEVDASTGYQVMPGALAAVAALEGMPTVATGLGTGNVRRAAEIKLTRCGLHERFAFGGFGCDAAERADLLRAGFERGAAQLGVPLAACDQVVVGDTPLDVIAAKRVGARAVAVGTGGHTLDELRESGADAVLSELTSPAALTAILASR